MRLRLNIMIEALILLFCSIGALSITSCSDKNTIPAMTPLESALAQAGKNRAELEKVLHRYSQIPTDSLKYKAACFLIENMPHYTYYEGKQLDNYLNYYAILKGIRGRGIDSSVAVDSIKKMYGDYSIHSLRLKRDIEEIDSTYLCRNIEWAFKVWHEQPWGKNVSFSDFCEYVLPYRIEDEKLTDWREMIYKKYNLILDSLRTSTLLDREDPIQAALYLSKAITSSDETYFTTASPASLPHVGPVVAQLRCGSCRELSDFLIYACRALGIPCSIDYMPLRGNDNARHFWVSFWDKYGELYLQEYPDQMRMLRESGMPHLPKVKVYRQTFSLNRTMQNEMLALDTVVVPLFQKPHFIDVTYPYARDYKENLHIPSSAIYSGKPSSKIAYLCTSRMFDWAPVAWSTFDREQLSFHDIHKGTMMRVATLESDRLAFWTDPFWIDKANEFHFLSAKDSIQDVVLYAKFNLAEETFRGRMLGGVFEGSNDPSFKQKDTLFLVNEIPGRLNTVVQVSPRKPYRYVRYYGSPGGHCNISEAAFFGENGIDILKGKIIGTPGCAQNDGSHEYTNVFDGKSWTSFDYKEPSGGWSGLDLGAPELINKIQYTPRNRDNYIRPGDDFELFYCDKIWKSLGKVKSKSDSLVYKGVPKDALLLLVNHSRGVQKRIFTYEKGEQIWK